MSKVLIEEQTLEDIGDAIRGKNGLSTTYKPSGMPIAIASIPNIYAADDEGKVVSNSQLVTQTTKNILVNGTYDTTLNDNVVVNVSGGSTAARQYLIDPNMLDRIASMPLIDDNTYMMLTAHPTAPWSQHVYGQNTADYRDSRGFHVCPPTDEVTFDGQSCYTISYPAYYTIYHGSSTGESYYLASVIFLHPILPGAFSKAYLTMQAGNAKHRIGNSMRDFRFHVGVIKESQLSSCLNTDGWVVAFKQLYEIISSAMTADAIMAQQGITLSLDGNGSLPEQTVEIDIPYDTENLYFVMFGWQCEAYIRSLYLE